MKKYMQINLRLNSQVHTLLFFKFTMIWLPCKFLSMDGDLSLVGLRHWVGLGWNIRVSVDVPALVISFSYLYQIIQYVILYFVVCCLYLLYHINEWLFSVVLLQQLHILVSKTLYVISLAFLVFSVYTFICLSFLQ